MRDTLRNGTFLLHTALSLNSMVKSLCAFWNYTAKLFWSTKVVMSSFEIQGERCGTAAITLPKVLTACVTPQHTWASQYKVGIMQLQLCSLLNVAPGFTGETELRNHHHRCFSLLNIASRGTLDVFLISCFLLSQCSEKHPAVLLKQDISYFDPKCQSGLIIHSDYPKIM